MPPTRRTVSRVSSEHATQELFRRETALRLTTLEKSLAAATKEIERLTQVIFALDLKVIDLERERSPAT